MKGHHGKHHRHGGGKDCHRGHHGHGWRLRVHPHGHKDQGPGHEGGFLGHHAHRRRPHDHRGGGLGCHGRKHHRHGGHGKRHRCHDIDMVIGRNTTPEVGVTTGAVPLIGWTDGANPEIGETAERFHQMALKPLDP